MFPFFFFGTDAQPTSDAEKAVYDEVRVLLKQCAEVLKELDEYKGAGDHIRNVRSDQSSFKSGRENEEKAR